MQNISCNGMWQISGIDQSIPGKLTFSPQTGGRIELSLGSFEINKNLSEILLSEGITIQGEVKDFFDKYYTCLNCRSITPLINVGHQLTESVIENYYKSTNNTYTYIFDFLLEDYSIDNIDAPDFISCDVIYNQLENWLDYIPYTVGEKGYLQKGNDKKISIEINDISILINERILSHTQLLPPRSYVIESSPTMQIIFNTTTSIREVISYVEKVNTFLSFVTDEASWVSGISLSSDTQSGHYALYFRQVQFGKKFKPKGNWLIDSALIEKALPQIIIKWIDSYDKAPGAFILYFMTFYSFSTLTLEQLFLNLVSAYEGFYRDLYSTNNKYIKTAKFRAVKRQIDTFIDSLDTTEQLKAKLKSGIEHSNQKSLRTMIEDVFTNLYFRERGEPLTPKNISDFRNQYDHAKKEISVIERKKLYRACNILDKLIKYILLSSIFKSLSPEQTDRIIFSTNRF
ncbi:HEPN domain-containing protein [Sphaerochaeta globosa]|uniref:Uncharacterized protein n=1 Tax=Sphaerochaeta globosa (strain ATCC BAA-1886 / DSM 22777 / Buddy) TaxID=158189 RepID=F0RRF3_SPHGB|nr:HEPN domain-containing protein [Sphaerochaeta globosa]ADY14205.1 hypothetical protein SpiBuddy_2391 [Sphaerochaeta globosa str. Buddy]